MMPERRQVSTIVHNGVTSISVPNSLPAGGLSITQPAITAAASYYRVMPSADITFGWTLTSVVVAPTSLTLQAFCSQNGFTYPVGPTNGIPGAATQYIWNPYDYQVAAGATPLAQASYTLRIFDERGFYQTAAPGRMSPYSGTKFALYFPQSYTPLSSWSCPSCSYAFSGFSRIPTMLAIAMAIATGIAIGAGQMLARL
ncbi:hypothetical protein E5Q_04470 [Mixia osmundae IAM 14324]|nr:hypothetical protein E5Q_04470 [Mixia osmundae IAM 14324]